ncbi:MAG: nucleotidyltransferase domain-containing protein [bacterium]|nr:nucleotidyltransferase domain-containing protein [bacterium]
MNIELTSLTDYFEKKKDVFACYLFGSMAKDKASCDSDVDIAVLLKEENRRLEFTIWQDLENIFKREVDVVILNRAPAVLSWSIIRKGKPIAIKEKSRFLNFLFEVSNEAEDFIEFNLDALRRKNVRKRR